jgi:hypothetical protein
MAVTCEYDLETHTVVRDIILYPGVFLAISGVALWILILFAPRPTENADTKNWRTKYYELSCRSRGLELNTRNYNNYCMDPKSKALYEVD